MTARPLFTAPIEYADTGVPSVGQEKVVPADAAARALVLYDDVCGRVAELKTIAEAKDVIDVAAAAITFFVKVAKNKQLAIDAGELQIRAERRLGEMLAASERNRGARGSIVTGARREPVKDDAPTLAELGVDKKLSARSQRLAALPHERFEPMLGGWREKQERESGRVSARLVHDEAKAERRATREAELGAKIRALPDQRFGVILADPPWRYQPWSRGTGMDRAADNHYPTMPLRELQALPVPSIAADDCVLILCATRPMLLHAILLAAAWGFTGFDRDPDTGFLLPAGELGADGERYDPPARYASEAAWQKIYGGSGMGTGYWFRDQHEPILFFVRGDVPCPAPGTQHGSLISAEVQRHSQKPDAVYELIEAYFPTLPKIELFARSAREGWAAWGNEAA